MITRPGGGPAETALESVGRGVEAMSDRPFTVVDVALEYGSGFEGLRTYLHAKSSYAEHSGAFRHHVIVPASVERHFGGWHELPQSALSRRGRRRLPRHSRGVLALLGNIAPDVLLLHGPCSGAGRLATRARALGARVVVVPWRGALDAPSSSLNRWQDRRAKSALATRADAVLASPAEGLGGVVRLPLRLGVDRVFRARPGVRRGVHLLFVGELSRGNGVFDLLSATAYSSEPWEVHLYGQGADERAIRRRIASFGLAHRVVIHRYVAERPVLHVAERALLAEAMARAACVVVPGPPSRGRLVALEAAATGVPVVACDGAPINRLAPELVHSYPRGDITALRDAISAARAAAADPQTGERVSSAFAWEKVLQRELEDLANLAGRA
jgi:glycosyltransferase involved in cell wall biosynthesis